MAEIADGVRRQYRATDPLKVRMQTHERYSERRVDLDDECLAALALRGDEAILDVGCGPGRVLHHLRGHGHTGPLVGLDQSPAMLVEARSVTADASPPVGLVRGEANALPFRDGRFARVVARHMLYHVPDIPGALHEFARVLAPGGSVLAVTNVEGYLPKIDALRDDLLRAFDLPFQERTVISFRRDNGRPLLAATFGRVEEILLINTLMFREPEPIAAYIATMFPSWDFPEGSDLPERMHDWLVVEAGRRLAAEGGIWRDPKEVVLFRCWP